jgi:hypothetical protein
MTVRVTLGDSWTPLALAVSADETVAALVARALAAARIDPTRSGDYEMKFGGALVRDTGRTLRDVGVTDGAALVVVARRRRPVR